MKRKFLLVFTGIFLTVLSLLTSLGEFMFSAQLYVGSVLHELSYKELRFVCNNDLKNVLPELYLNYTKKLNAARDRVILNTSYHDQLTGKYTKDVILLKAGSTEDYQHRVDALGHVTTVMHICPTPTCGLPKVTRYKWGLSGGICPGKVNEICDDVPAHPVSHSLEREPERYELEQHSNQNPHFYVHLIPNGTVDNYGFVRTGNVIIVPYTCIKYTVVSAKPSTKQKEVFVITQYWGQGWYHGSIEDIPRLAAYIAFLRENPQIKIHMHSGSKQRMTGYLRMLGLDVSRVVSGPMQADIVYLPQGGGCGTLHQPSGSIVSSHFHSCMTNWNVESPSTGKLEPGLSPPRNLIILIKRTVRSQGRGLVQHNVLEERVRALAKEYELEFYTFVDTNIPSFSNMVTLFHRAVLIIGPHGAGLSNMIFSQPRTYIVEILCRSAINFCYVDIASKLGMHYHGVVSKSQGCQKMEFDLGDILYTLTFFLEDYKSRVS